MDSYNPEIQNRYKLREKHGQTQHQPLLKISGHSLLFRSLGPKTQLCQSHVILHPPLEDFLNLQDINFFLNDSNFIILLVNMGVWTTLVDFGFLDVIYTSNIKLIT